VSDAIAPGPPSDPSGSSRLFCALDLPDSTVELVASWQRRQGAGEGLRPVGADALHLTVAFLGDVPNARIPELAELVDRVEARPVGGRLLPSPVPMPRRRPRLFALEVESSAAERLAAEVRRALEGIGLELPDRRPFWPHLTVFRLKGRRPGKGRGSGPGRAPAQRLEPLPEADGHAFGCVRFALYRSELGPSGSTYSRLAARELPQPGGRQKR